MRVVRSLQAASTVLQIDLELVVDMVNQHPDLLIQGNDTLQLSSLSSRILDEISTRSGSKLKP